MLFIENQPKWKTEKGVPVYLCGWGPSYDSIQIRPLLCLICNWNHDLARSGLPVWLGQAHKLTTVWSHSSHIWGKIRRSSGISVSFLHSNSTVSFIQVYLFGGMDFALARGGLDTSSGSVSSYFAAIFTDLTAISAHMQGSYFHGKFQAVLWISFKNIFKNHIFNNLTLKNYRAL